MKLAAEAPGSPAAKSSSLQPKPLQQLPESPAAEASARSPAARSSSQQPQPLQPLPVQPSSAAACSNASRSRSRSTTATELTGSCKSPARSPATSSPAARAPAKSPAAKSSSLAATALQPQPLQQPPPLQPSSAAAGSFPPLAFAGHFQEQTWMTSTTLGRKPKRANELQRSLRDCDTAPWSSGAHDGSSHDQGRPGSRPDQNWSTLKRP